MVFHKFGSLGLFSNHVCFLFKNARKISIFIRGRGGLIFTWPLAATAGAAAGGATAGATAGAAAGGAAARACPAIVVVLLFF